MGKIYFKKLSDLAQIIWAAAGLCRMNDRGTGMGMCKIETGNVFLVRIMIP
jgi:hypothetical protein